jgi:hypothetical protein
MTSLFLDRLSEALKETPEETSNTDEVSLVLVADKLVSKYYNEDKNMVHIIEKMNHMYKEFEQEDIKLWTTLCSQVLVLKLAKTKNDDELRKQISQAISKTLEKF